MPLNCKMTRLHCCSKSPFEIQANITCTVRRSWQKSEYVLPSGLVSSPESNVPKPTNIHKIPKQNDWKHQIEKAWQRGLAKARDSRNSLGTLKPKHFHRTRREIPRWELCNSLRKVAFDIPWFSGKDPGSGKPSGVKHGLDWTYQFIPFQTPSSETSNRMKCCPRCVIAKFHHLQAVPHPSKNLLRPRLHHPNLGSRLVWFGFILTILTRLTICF